MICTKLLTPNTYLLIKIDNGYFYWTFIGPYTPMIISYLFKLLVQAGIPKRMYLQVKSIIFLSAVHYMLKLHTLTL